MNLPVNVLFQVAEAHSLINPENLGACPEILNTACRACEMRLSSAAHLHFDHTWGNIPVWVDKTHRNSLTIYLVASDLISKGEDVYHPDAGQDELKYTLFS